MTYRELIRMTKTADLENAPAGMSQPSQQRAPLAEGQKAQYRGNLLNHYKTVGGLNDEQANFLLDNMPTTHRLRGMYTTRGADGKSTSVDYKGLYDAVSRELQDPPERAVQAAQQMADKQGLGIKVHDKDYWDNFDARVAQQTDPQYLRQKAAEQRAGIYRDAAGNLLSPEANEAERQRRAAGVNTIEGRSRKAWLQKGNQAAVRQDAANASVFGPEYMQRQQAAMERADQKRMDDYNTFIANNPQYADYNPQAPVSSAAAHNKNVADRMAEVAAARGSLTAGNAPRPIKDGTRQVVQNVANESERSRAPGAHPMTEDQLAQQNQQLMNQKLDAARAKYSDPGLTESDLVHSMQMYTGATDDDLAMNNVISAELDRRRAAEQQRRLEVQRQEENAGRHAAEQQAAQQNNPNTAATNTYMQQPEPATAATPAAGAPPAQPPAVAGTPPEAESEAPTRTSAAGGASSTDNSPAPTTAGAEPGAGTGAGSPPPTTEPDVTASPFSEPFYGNGKDVSPEKIQNHRNITPSEYIGQYEQLLSGMQRIANDIYIPKDKRQQAQENILHIQDILAQLYGEQGKERFAGVPVLPVPGQVMSTADVVQR